MEEKEIELLGKTFQEVNNLEGRLVTGSVEKNEAKISQKSTEKLTQEEESLKVHLEKLKKGNFMLQASIKAWQTTLKNKRDELKNANLKLDEIHNSIWSERESFCSKSDEFNRTYGILSEWWDIQLKLVILESLEKKNLENEKGRKEIEKLEEEVEDLKKEINELQGRTQVAVVKVHMSEEGHEPIRKSNIEDQDEAITGTKPAKKIRYSNEKEIEILKEDQPSTALYAMVSLEKVRKINRNKNRPQ